MPQFGGGTLSSAALRNYALTLNAGLAPHSVYAGTITIGGLIESSDIHKANTAAGGAIPTLNPDDLALSSMNSSTNPVADYAGWRDRQGESRHGCRRHRGRLTVQDLRRFAESVPELALRRSEVSTFTTAEQRCRGFQPVLDHRSPVGSGSTPRSLVPGRCHYSRLAWWGASRMRRSPAEKQSTS